LTLTRERLATLHAPSRRVRFGDGAFVSRVGSEADEPLLLRPRAGNDYPVDVVWLAEPGVALTRGATGVVIVEGDSPVARWAALPRLAYGADTGTGAITTEEWADRSTIVFSNGFGDGGFPHGTPPRQVTEREAELAKCLRGGWVTSDGYDRCRVVGR
jgi:hypothetical protein